MHWCDDVSNNDVIKLTCPWSWYCFFFFFFFFFFIFSLSLLAQFYEYAVSGYEIKWKFALFLDDPRIYCVTTHIYKRGCLMRQRCLLSHVTGASYLDWLTVGQGLLFLQQVRVDGKCFYFFCFFTLIHFSLSPLSLSFLSFTISSISSRSVGDDTKWPPGLTCR